MSSRVESDPRVELLWWRGCPSWERALAELRGQMRRLELDPERVEVIEVGSDEQAERERFVGSPTIRVDGIDLQAPGEQPSGLTCRVYRLRGGHISALPDPEDIRDALLRAIEAER